MARTTLPLSLETNVGRQARDFVAYDGDVSIGRVYQITSISTGGWFWT